MGLNISFVIHISYGKMMQKCKNSNFPPVTVGNVPEQKGYFHVWRWSASLPAYSLWYKSNRHLIHYPFQCNVHKCVIAKCYYLKLFPPLTSCPSVNMFLFLLSPFYCMFSIYSPEANIQSLGLWGQRPNLWWHYNDLHISFPVVTDPLSYLSFCWEVKIIWMKWACEVITTLHCSHSVALQMGENKHSGVEQKCSTGFCPKAWNVVRSKSQSW